jgi:hypothetical protein
MSSSLPIVFQNRRPLPATRIQNRTVYANPRPCTCSSSNTTRTKRSPCRASRFYLSNPIDLPLELCAQFRIYRLFFLSYRFYKCQFLREPRAQLCAWFPEKWPFVEMFVCVVPRGEPVLEKFCARSSIYKAPSDLIDSNSCEKGISREPRAQSCLRGAFLREPRAQKSLKGVPSQGTACTKVLGRGPVVERIVCVVP